PLGQPLRRCPAGAAARELRDAAGAAVRGAAGQPHPGHDHRALRLPHGAGPAAARAHAHRRVRRPRRAARADHVEEVAHGRTAARVGGPRRGDARGRHGAAHLREVLPRAARARDDAVLRRRLQAMVTRFRALWLPLAVGAGSLALTAGMWLHETRTEQAQLRASFDFGLRQTASRIEQRLSASEQMLRGVQGFFEAMPDADERSFETYANAFVGSADEAGLQAVAYARLARVQREGRIVDAAPILQVVPRQGANTSALGYDPLAEPLRRAAMLRARDSGNTTITDKLRLVTEPQRQPQWGFLMFVPLYERGAAIDSVDARRRHLRGWVWAAFRVGDLMASLYGEGEPGLEVRIHDGVELTPGTLMFGSAVGEADEASRPALQAQEYIGLPGH